MRNQINVRTLLEVFDTLRRHGRYTERGIELDNVVGLDNGDGYSLSLSDGEVTVDLNFHNSYHFHLSDAPFNINHTATDRTQVSKAKIDDFVGKLERLHDKYH
ncbi:DUF3081 family protein [Thaumasiovibrio subtropicus]|uniref:DUF3081 family protein n=1 Tax=Thaumasiovibrio subtropicus TaxID=1891207 RepID=UPI000B353B3C|nr:DUF3081 family protein [Thaumasiovibrio subtropicus]